MSQKAPVLPLDGYRILDLSDKEGNYGTRVLGCFGADVINVEKPGGNPSRWLGPFYHDIADPEMSLFYWYYNTNKRGITLDIETREGQRIFKQLVKTADVVFESFPPGHMDSLGLGYSSLSKINPGLIMVSITPFGQTGPYKDWKGSDLIYSAMGGLSTPLGEPGKPPIRFTCEQSYLESGTQAAAAAVGAIFYRDRTGEGQYIDVSMHEVATSLCWQLHIYWDVQQLKWVRRGRSFGIGASQQRIPTSWPCQDGYVTFGILTQKLAPLTMALVKWMAEEGMAEDLMEVNWKELDSAKLTMEQANHFVGVFAKFFLTKTKKELAERGIRDRNVVYPSNTPADLLVDSQLASRNFWVQVDVPKSEGEKIPSPTIPIISSEITWEIKRAPMIGEHNLEIYQGELGMSDAKFRQLKKKNII